LVLRHNKHGYFLTCVRHSPHFTITHYCLISSTIHHWSPPHHYSPPPCCWSTLICVNNVNIPHIISWGTWFDEGWELRWTLEFMCIENSVGKLKQYGPHYIVFSIVLKFFFLKNMKEKQELLFLNTNTINECTNKL
jgi:hypothetical protein